MIATILSKVWTARPHGAHEACPVATTHLLQALAHYGLPIDMSAIEIHATAPILPAPATAALRLLPMLHLNGFYRHEALLLLLSAELPAGAWIT